MSVWSIRRLVVLLPAALIASAAASRAQESANPAAAVLTRHIMIRPADVRWGPCLPALPPGAQCAVVEGNPSTPNVLFAYRLKMPSGYRIAPHFHPGDEHVVIIKGTLNMGLGDVFDRSKTKPMGAGSFLALPKGTHHFAWAEGETILQVYAIGPWAVTYVNPRDDPRARP
jgi:quercetin dioxygenase-like cupin family protein